MPSEIEDRCCHMDDNSKEDSLKLKEKVLETEGTPKCITKHPGYADCCLSVYVLQMCLHTYIRDEGPLGDDELINE